MPDWFSSFFSVITIFPFSLSMRLLCLWCLEYRTAVLAIVHLSVNEMVHFSLFWLRSMVVCQIATDNAEQCTGVRELGEDLLPILCSLNMHVFC